MQMANANLNPCTEAKLDPANPDRGPLLIIDGEKDHTVPWAIANASYKRQRHNKAVTEIQKIPNRGHSLTIDSGWREVAHGPRLREAVRLVVMRHAEDNVMARHQVRPVPVVENDRLVGIVAQVHIARTENEKKTGQPVEAISEPSQGERRTSPVAGLRIT